MIGAAVPGEGFRTGGATVAEAFVGEGEMPMPAAAAAAAAAAVAAIASAVAEESAELDGDVGTTGCVVGADGSDVATGMVTGGERDGSNAGSTWTCCTVGEVTVGLSMRKAVEMRVPYLRSDSGEARTCCGSVPVAEARDVHRTHGQDLEMDGYTRHARQYMARSALFVDQALF